MPNLLITHASDSCEPGDLLEQLWATGQDHLARGLYIRAVGYLQSAEKLAFLRRDAASLARLTLPLMEACRLIRHQAAEGAIWVMLADDTREARQSFQTFLKAPAATLLLFSPLGISRLHAWTRRGIVEARGNAQSLEILWLVGPPGKTRLASPQAPHLGLPVEWTLQAERRIVPADFSQLRVLLPPPTPQRCGAALAAMTGESLLLAWEALGLQWLARQNTGVSGGGTSRLWGELEWLRQARQIDPASEPLGLRQVSLCEELLQL